MRKPNAKTRFKAMDYMLYIYSSIVVSKKGRQLTVTFVSGQICHAKTVSREPGEGNKVEEESDTAAYWSGNAKALLDMKYNVERKDDEARQDARAPDEGKGKRSCPSKITGQDRELCIQETKHVPPPENREILDCVKHTVKASMDV